MGELRFPEDYYKYDKSDMKAVIDDFPNQVRQALKMAEGAGVQKADRIYWFGMGGSAIAGMMLKSYLHDKIPVEVVNSYEFPPGVPKNALLIFCSYSGNTEETLSTYKLAAREYKNVLSLSIGGKLQEAADMNRLQHIILPKVLQPRNSLGIQFMLVLKILSNTGMVEGFDNDAKLLLDKLNMQALANHGMEISKKLKDKIPLIYASNVYYAVAYRWKCEINENAKHMAFAHEFPELCHNEILGYNMLKAEYYGIIIRFDDDHRRVQKRMDLIKDIMKKSGVEVTEIALKGNRLTKMFTAILLGDYAAYYLGIGYKLDPEPVVIIEKFKKDLGPFV